MIGIVIINIREFNMIESIFPFFILRILRPIFAMMNGIKNADIPNHIFMNKFEIYAPNPPIMLLIFSFLF